MILLPGSWIVLIALDDDFFEVFRMVKDDPHFHNKRPSPSTGDVFVSFGEDGYRVTRDVLEKIPFDFSLLEDKHVLIKPNAGRMVDPHLGINVSPEVVAGVVDFLLDRGVRNLFVGESPIMGVKALEALEKSGISPLVRERAVPLVDLDAADPLVIPIPSPKVIRELKVCREAWNADFIISVPVMKTHMHTQASLGIKNMKGCLYKREKVRLHQLPASEDAPPPAKPLDMAIADLAKILTPDLTVIDGIVGQEGLGPSAGSPKKLGAVVCSMNCLGADSVAAELMGIDPASIHHLRLAFSEMREAGKILDQFNVYPEDYKQRSLPFAPPPEKISLEFENVRVEDRDSCSACLSTVLMFLRRYYEDFADYFSESSPLKLALGKGIGPQEEGTVLIGNCAAHRKAGCIFVKGCPPVASEILRALEAAGKLK